MISFFKKNKFEYIAIILSILASKKKEIPTILFFTLIISVVEILSIGLIFPFVAILVDPNLVLNQKILQNFFNSENINYDRLVLILSISLVIIFIIKFYLNIKIYGLIISFAEKNGLTIQLKLLKKYQHINYLKFTERNSSTYINYLNSFVQQFTYVIRSLLVVISEIFIIIVITIFLITVTGMNFAIIAIIFLSIIFFFNNLFRTKVRSIGEKINFYQQNMIKQINESILGYKDIKILQKENFFHSKFSELAKNFTNLKINYSIIQIFPRLTLELIIIIGVIITILVSNFYFDNLQTVLPIVSMYAVSLLRIFPSATKIINNIIYLNNGRDAVYKINEDLENIKLQENKKQNQSITFINLEMRNISFKYPNQQKLILDNFNMKIESGNIYGIKGKSGRGKSTIANILLGLIKPSSGKIFINNKEINLEFDLPDNFYAYLPQEIFLIDDSIKNNIALGENNINEEKLYSSIKKANLEEFIEGLPNKINTISGERGIRISGGQKQRIALARSFYFDSKILVLDESTNSLDGDTQKNILHEIKNLKSEKTIIFISHDDKDLSICDVIINLDEN